MVSHCCFPAFAAGQMPVLRTVVVFVSIQLPSVGTGIIVCVVFVCVISAAVFGVVLFIVFGLRRPRPLGRGGSKPSSFHRLI